MESIPTPRALTPFLPAYRLLRDYVRLLDGVPLDLYREMQQQIVAQAGSPEEQTDWTDPDSWIPRRLAGDEGALALRIWRESGGELNPRYLNSAWLFSQTHDLLAEDDDGLLQITGRGRAFLDRDAETVAEIDRYEGHFVLLAIVADEGPAKRKTLYPPWAAFCRAQTGYQSENSILLALRYRLLNLLDRDLVERAGYFYRLTDAGAAYLAREPGRAP